MIDPRAVIDPAAQIDEGVSIGPFTTIGAGVSIGRGTVVGANVVICGDTTIGEENHIYSFASIGEAPQDKKYAGEPTRLVIGDRNQIREFTTLHRGTSQDQGVTRIGSDNLLMAYTHVAHDCVLGDNIILANGASLAGHVQVQDWAILGGFTLVHQFCQVGAHSFCGMGAHVAKDIPPYVMVSGQPAKPHGINKEGLKRRGFDEQAIRALMRGYRLLYREGLTLEQAGKALAELAQESPEVSAYVEFLARSERSIVR